ncbi:MAG: transposase [Anaerolineales bacterium]|nr:transposase [Anaerolineales bacterium]
MVWLIIKLIFSAILDIITVCRQSTLEKDLEILVLRQQLSILQRKLNSPIRDECLNHILIINPNHLKRVLFKFSDYYNASRPHQGIDQQIPIPHQTQSIGMIHRRKVLGGIINDYYRPPSPTALSTSTA